MFENLEEAVKEDKTLDSNLNVKEIFGSWSNQKGFPLLKVTRNYKNGSVTLYQEKYDDILNDIPDKTIWWIPYNYASANEPDFDHTTPNGWLGNRLKLIEANTIQNLSNGDWLIFNRQHTGYYRVLYDTTNYKLIQNEFISGNMNRIHPYCRSQIIADLQDFTRTDRLPYRRLFDLIAYLKNEKEYAPWASAKSVILELNQNLAASNKKKSFKSFVAKLVEPLYRSTGLDNIESELYSHKYLRTIAIELACRFGVDVCLKETHSKFQQFIDSGIELPLENRGSILTNGVRSATAKELEKLWSHLLRSKNSDERNVIVHSFGFISHSSIWQDFLNKAFEDLKQNAHLESKRDVSILSISENDENVDKISKTERSILLSSIINNNENGGSHVINLLKNNLTIVNDRIADLKSIFKTLAQRITTVEMQNQVGISFLLVNFE